MDRDEPAPQPIATVLRELVVRFGEKLRIFADTAELAALYAPLSDASVGVAPLPVVVPPVSHRLPHDPPHLVFAGGARAEKGYARLPALVGALRGKVRFTIHSGPVDAAADPLVQRTHRALRRCVGPNVDLVERGLTPDSYQALLADADLLLLPYDAVAYGPRSSGILAEARALGVPAIVPAGCWMESAAGPVRDVIFHGDADFNPTVSRVLEALPSVTAALREAAPLWRCQHSPEALLQTLLPSPLLSSRPEAGKRGVKIYG
jgi:glycosyltransferase involved in cell wall biosynthesis